MLQGMASQPAVATSSCPLVTLDEIVDDLENGWSPKCLDRPAKGEEWGVLKVGAVSFGIFDVNQNKALPSHLKPRPSLEVKAGEVLISRANVTRYVGACAYVHEIPPQLMLCDKIFRVKFAKNSKIKPRFLAEVMWLPFLRAQIETRITGTSPTMKNISKPALLKLRLPLPSLEQQELLVMALEEAKNYSARLRKDATDKRQSAWAAFESALFESGYKAAA